MRVRLYVTGKVLSSISKSFGKNGHVASKKTFGGGGGPMIESK